MTGSDLHMQAKSPVPVSIRGAPHLASASFVGESWSGRLAPRPGGVLLGGSARAYLMVGGQKAQINLLGKTMRFTADVAHVPCGNIAALCTWLQRLKYNSD